jgi:hypothetical protein
LLRLPQNGPLVVVAAEVPSIGRHGLPRAEHILRDDGLFSMWRLLPNVEIGVVSLPGPAAQLDRLADALSACGTGRVGISPPYSDLRATPQALTLARIALTSTLPERGVTIFDRHLLAIASVSAPDVMEHLASLTLARLAAVPDKERTTLLDAFEAWLDNGGSAQGVADQLSIHRNTVHQRLRKLEHHTGQDLADPRSAALLTSRSKSSAADENIRARIVSIAPAVGPGRQGGDDLVDTARLAPARGLEPAPGCLCRIRCVGEQAACLAPLSTSCGVL